MSVESSTNRFAFLDRALEFATSLRQKNAAQKIQRMAANLQANGIPLELEDFGWSAEKGFAGYLSISPFAVQKLAETAKEAGLIDEKRFDYLTN